MLILLIMAKTVDEVLFLREVHLSGYKSINQVDIELNKGLNIIIGKNAAGKTNFLKFLNKSLSFDYVELNNFSSDLLFQNEKKVLIKANRNIEVEKLLESPNLTQKVNTKLEISGKLIFDKNNIEQTLGDKLKLNDVVFDSTFLCHGIPKEYWVVDKPFSFKTKKGKMSNDLSNVFLNAETPYFIRSIMVNIVFAVLLFDEINIEIIKNRLNNTFKEIEAIKETLNRYSPIQDIRFSNNYNIFIEEDKEGFTLNNLFLEFKIDNNWLPYSSLSDGTKRLFYIISEVYEIETNNVRPSSNGTFYDSSKISRIILIEEPELGIHPHQFQKLMEFLKEESERKQIIITTHSPQALDTLDEDEFNRIIIAFSNNGKEGTKLRHLNDEELLKAKAYIKDDFLSDYWLYSDLEK